MLKRIEDMDAKKEYVCDECRKAPMKSGYPRKYRWKTEKGFLGHSCYKDEQEMLRKRQEDKIISDRISLERFVSESKYKVGDHVFYVTYTVVKPTHEWRYGRLVHVRYEEERSYWNSSGTISEIGIGKYRVNNDWIWLSDICESEREAHDRALEAAKGYKEHCDFSSFVR